MINIKQRIYEFGFVLAYFIVSICVYYINEYYFHIKNGIPVNEGSVQLSFVKLSSNLPRFTFPNLNGPVDEESIRSCLEEMRKVRELILESSIFLESCLLELEENKSKYVEHGEALQLKCIFYDKHCKEEYKGVKIKQEQRLGSEECEQLANDIFSSRKKLVELNSQFHSNERKCENIEKEIKKLEKTLETLDKKCSEIERRYLSQHGSEMNVVEDPYVLEKPFKDITSDDSDKIKSLIRTLESEFNECKKELESLSERLSEKSLKIDEIKEKLGEIQELEEKSKSKSGKTVKLFTKIKRKVKTKAECSDEGASSSSTEQRASLESELASLMDGLSGIKKILYKKEKECKRIGTNIEKSKERLEKSRTCQPEHESSRHTRCCGCFSRLCTSLQTLGRRIRNRFRTRRTSSTRL
ncbi:hypothetical protein FG386_002423 [Cryptosporidium ryanae]|uniref:uncharacterized protein n=1 Tax=Cryptosporidium ryanae TaxID=515981 RepID=UPI00351A9357|nr:hypothetical protein FG386_002423 [Cryptosporidium ryanae]